MASFERRLEAKFQSSDPNEIREAAVEFVRWHRNWYRRWSYTYGTFWNALTLGIIFLSAAAAILSALEVAQEYKWISVLVSSTAALFGTLLVQFRVRDLWQIREIGRVDCQSVLTEALSIPVDNEAKARTEALKLRERTVQIERDQALKFFANATDGKDASANRKDASKVTTV